MTKTDFITTRDTYLKQIRNDLLGPGSEISYPDTEHELISDSPERRYFVGVLYPKENASMEDSNETSEILSSENNDDTENDESIESNNTDLVFSDDKELVFIENEKDDNVFDEDERADENVNLACQNRPSSFGINFIVELSDSSEVINNIICHIDFATYKKSVIEDCVLPINIESYNQFHIHDSLSPYMEYDPVIKMLRLKRKIERKAIRNLLENSNMSDEERNIGRLLYSLVSQLKNGYVRVPHSADVSIDFLDNSDYCETNTIEDTPLKAAALRRRISKGKFALSVMLINSFESEDYMSNLGQHCIFQPVISIESQKNGFVFCSYSDNPDFENMNDEDKSMEMQYRNKKIYANGMGVSVDWSSIDKAGNGCLKSEFLPIYELPGVEFDVPKVYGVNSKAFSMKYLSDLDEADKNEKIESLETLATAYKKWIDNIKEKAASLDDKYHEIANKNINACYQAYDRMKNGLKTLAENNDAWTAFLLANRAMYMQRVHIKLQDKPTGKPYYPDNEEIKTLLKELDYYTIDNDLDDGFKWRPFQIGFLLMSIDSIVNDKSIDRELIDLIWFPTGGGKTEAYLGLTAFTIFYRRLHYKNSYGGTNVIMRYTLRLLTAQQFTRASTLICACEFIRTDKSGKYPKYELGKEEISIGLWIGSSHTPNTISDAETNLKNLKNGSTNLKYRLDRYNKFQVLKCPWCGTSLVKGLNEKNKEIGEWGYALSKKRFEIRCTNRNCYFDMRGHLPVQVVDEELYNNPPTLLFATVDKLAMLPWKSETGVFFASDSNNRTPELIIQDELHLISGPLGTMVGLYETALDYLCGIKGSKTKIIASTATIKKATEQCYALYDRKVSQFPHPGIDAEDSFFSHEATINHDEEKYGRCYIGIMPSGKTKVLTEAQIISVLMQRIHTMNLPDEIKDEYWSLVLYFNTIKDLGKCTTLLEDDVKDIIKKIAGRCNEPIRKSWHFDELTSRVPTTKLNETMDTLERIRYTSKDNRCMDAVLATNMISVGIDISRLNVMLIVGQPKLTGEYIQASSRVGRAYPGMTLVLYDSTKSRDRSHYEQFKTYHENLYRYVEPTVATPFSEPSRERALHAIIVTMLRHTIEELSQDDSASLFSSEIYKDNIEKIKQLIIERASRINAIMNPGADDESDDISREIDIILEKWKVLAESNEHLSDRFYYGSRFLVREPDKDKKEGRLLKPFNTSKNDSAFDTMTSMRSVDTMVAGKLLIWEKNK